MKKNKAKKNNINVHEKEDAIDMQGVIEEALPSAMFKVICENDLTVLATISGRLRVNNIRLVPGDSVMVEVSPYDLTRGRITWRK